MYLTSYLHVNVSYKIFVCLQPWHRRKNLSSSLEFELIFSISHCKHPPHVAVTVLYFQACTLVFLENQVLAHFQSVCIDIEPQMQCGLALPGNGLPMWSRFGPGMSVLLF